MARLDVQTLLSEFILFCHKTQLSSCEQKHRARPDNKLMKKTVKIQLLMLVVSGIGFIGLVLVLLHRK